MTDSVSLREHIEALLSERDLRLQQRFDAQSAAISAAFAAAKEAVIKAEIASENRFASVNEFRGQLNDMVSTLIPRGEASARFEILAGKIELLRERMDKSDGSGSGLKLGWTLLTGVIVLAATVVGMFLALSGR